MVRQWLAKVWMMPDNRLDPALVTPSYEDAGLFKYDLCSLNLSLLPGVRRNARADYIFDAMIDGKYRAPIFFAGRRARQTFLMLDAMTRMARGVPLADPADDDLPDSNPDLYLAYDGPSIPLQVNGAWRSPVIEDDQGFARPMHQFIAAVWTLNAGTGPGMQFGAPPVR
ncbi:MAG: hypothetical protein ACJAQV_001362 [Loktanella salsilacus]|jgi:hypothetical protein